LGKAIFKTEQPDRTIQKVLFTPDSSELVVLSSIRGTNSNTESCQFFSVGQFPIITAPRRSTGFVHNNPNFSAECEVLVDMSYQVGRGVFPYTLRQAQFSSDGRKLIAVTNHIQGSAMVFMVFKDDEDQWTFGGSEQIVVSRLDHRDDDCLGFTGISL